MTASYNISFLGSPEQAESRVRDPGVEKLHLTTLQFLQRNTANQTAQQRSNPTVEGCLRVRC